MADDVISKDEFLTWVPASDAVRELRKTMLDEAAWEIVRRAAADFLVARIERGRIAKGALPVSLSPYQRIGDTTWKKLLQHGAINSSSLWLTNSLEVTLTIAGGEKTLQLFGIRFDPIGLEEMIPRRVVAPAPPTTGDRVAGVILRPAPAAATPTPKPVAQPAKLPPALAPSRAGRPRKEFWDDLIIATCRAIWLGDLKPQTQAEIERWMLRWASENGHDDLGDTSVKVPAKKVFNAFQD